MKANELTIFKSDDLVRCITDGIANWKKAGDMVVNAIDHGGMSLQSIADSCGSECITVEVLAQFERIGRKQVMPQVFALPCAAQKYLERLPYSEQQRLLYGAVPVVLIKDGKVDVLEVSVKNLTRYQCKQVFNSGGVRSVEAQRAWLESEREKKTAQMSSPRQVPWIVKQGKVVFTEPCEINRHDLATILSQIA
jgi:hypothetical protein